MAKRLIVYVLIALLAWPAGAADPEDLPDIGSPADALLTRGKAEAIGRGVLRQMRDAGYVLEDPEIAEYIDSIGHRISATAHEGDHEFTFFVVSDDAINAFALPGGYVGVNTGLIAATRSESELAGVLSHEVAHVTQNHIARRAAATGRNSILASAAVLAAILMGATGAASGDAVEAAILGAQGMAVQEQINYTRANEHEADRVGLQFLSEAGFDPMGMPSFFEVLSRLGGGGSPGNRVPEILLTHPLSSARISETTERAERIKAGVVEESPLYPLMQARIRVLGARSADEALDYYRNQTEGEFHAAAPEVRYGYALALMRAGRYADAVPILYSLRQEDETIVAYHSALGQAEVMAGRSPEGLLTLRQAMRLFPRNVPLTVRYGEALLRTGQFEEAHTVLLDLFNNVAPTPAQIRLIANAADAAGQRAEALYYMSEYHLLTGHLPQAVEQLKLALRVPELQSWQRARFEARLAELEPYLKKQRRGS
jgi:predicted Zn-dependent protease